MRANGIDKVMLVTDNSTLAGWIENPKKNKAYVEYMNRAVEHYRAGANKEITLGIGLCEVRDYEKSYKFCREDKVINDAGTVIEKDSNGKKAINLETSNIKYTTVNDIKNINIAKPEIVGM